MGYLHIGKNVTVEERRIIGIFDLDNTTESKYTRSFLAQAEEEGRSSLAATISRSHFCCVTIPIMIKSSISRS